jgi:hypothetical protein
MSELDKILNDDLLKCEIVESVECSKTCGSYQVDARRFIFRCRLAQGHRKT